MQLSTINSLLLFSIVQFQITLSSSEPFDFHEPTENVRKILRLAKSAEMRNYMKNSTSPCDDFYQFACGNWKRINPALGDRKTDIFGVLEKAYNRRLQRLLGEPKRTNESDMERKVKYFYESCLDREQVKRNYRQKLLGIMEEFGGMPALKGEQWQSEEFDWLKVVALILRKFGKQIIIAVTINADLTNTEVNRLYIGQLNNLISTRATDYYVRSLIAIRMALQKVLGMSLELASQTAVEIVDFERALAKGISDPQEGLGMEDLTRLRLLDEMTESYKPVLNFTKLIQTWLGYEYNLPVYEYVESYHRNLRNVIEEKPKHIIGNYIMWEMLQDFRMEVEETQEKQVTKCVEVTKTYFLKYVDNMMYRYGVQKERDSVKEVEEVWRGLKQAFEMTLGAAKWMTERTRDKALEKLSAMEFAVNTYENENFDKEFGELTISTVNFFENVVNILELRGRNFRLQLHARPKLDEAVTLNYSPAYAPDYNKVLIPVAFLQPHYLWSQVYPTALKYATYGYIIAHEMAHGFDDNIRKYDAKGNLNDWWDRKSTEAFTSRKECLRQQFSEFKYAGKQLQRMNAQGENIADNVGIRVAFAAYQNWLMQQTTENSTRLQQESLPNMDLTPRQLFFLGAAQVWCTDVNRQILKILSATDVHAPEEVRVMAMFANFDDFAVEWKCELGRKMNPSHKCVIY